MKYTNPTAVEVRKILEAFELSGKKAAEQTGIFKDDGEPNARTFRRFTAINDGFIKMPYAVLFTLVAKNIGRYVAMDNWREVLIEEGILHQKKQHYMS